MNRELSPRLILLPVKTNSSTPLTSRQRLHQQQSPPQSEKGGVASEEARANESDNEDSGEIANESKEESSSGKEIDAIIETPSTDEMRQ
ncbi:hypothetical protein HAX54_049445 [Datura stramonium]|uniref:Uncharacterized protein n=1 Tax=Datura stramonium TaxID=4076 RepID=A0ABS8WKG9_DATST|nr:hypothetical protein [Datura stramonium]